MKPFFLFIAASLIALTLGCGSSTSTSGVTSLASLPKATGATSATASISSNSTRNALQSATSGTTLASWYTAFNGQTTKSQTFCQLGLQLREVIRSASQPDKIACYMGVMEQFSSLSSWPSNGSDGNYHYVLLSGAGGGDGKIKFRITKSGDTITGMDMFSGFGGGVQTEYVSMATSGSTITLTSVQYYTGGGQTSRGRVTVSGTVNSSGVWTSAKTMVAEATRSETSPSTRTQNSRIELVQYSDRYQVTGYDTGSDNGNSFTTQVFSLVQLLTPNPLSTLALGEGTAKISMTHASYGSFAQTRAWNGDTRVAISPATTADYYTTVDATSLPSAPSSYDTTFTAAETWDLTPPAGESFITSTFSAMEADATASAAFAQCNTNYGYEGESNWPDCWSLSND